MHLKALIPLSPVLTTVVADYDLRLRTCSTGLGEFGQDWTQGVATRDEDVCGCCNVSDDIGGGEARGGNPCNGSCGDDLIYRWKGNDYDIIVANTGIKVGECRRQDGRAACNAWNYSCYETKMYRCYTYYRRAVLKRGLNGQGGSFHCLLLHPTFPIRPTPSSLSRRRFIKSDEPA
ncbi:hypothetical protein QBC46DRAFT_413343 [Diplogelasinospora grovesii]|uniref:Uncharacterized protein n=1 Tax=Diplogelasinospora grovesii TaxID=303347 RepID=A0AAN6MXE8_9PEZI|nr:hypothetical protein QBC46DRAFT_413343 [Diplogelasinospora grovesii]